MLAGHNLHVVDYLVMAGMLMMSLGIGIYHSLAKGGNKTTTDYFLGGRSQGVFPISISIFASFVSSILILGFPAETYTNGAMFILSTLGIGLGAIMAAVVFVPVFYPLKITSINEYLRRRYKSRVISIIGTVGGVAGMMFYTGTVYYAPSTAIEAVTGFPTWASILIGSLITVIYTTIGGFKAVVWTDVFQALIMVGALVAVTVQAVLKVGSMEEVWEVCSKWDRLNFFDFNPDPTVRFTFWALVLGKGLGYLSIYGTTQTSVQRYCSLPTRTKAILSVFGAVPWALCMVTFACITGLTVFAYYANIGCDPLDGRFITNPNQIIPHFVMDLLYYPGVPGILLAGLISGSLSSASSALNSSAANIWDDIIVKKWPDIPAKKKITVTKILVVICGIVSTGFGFMVSLLGGTVVQVMSTFVSSISGPLTALFLLGVCVPFANFQGALVGSACSFVFALWVGVGSYLMKRQKIYLPSTIENCTAYGMSFMLSAVDAFDSNITTENTAVTSSIQTVAPTLSDSSELSGLHKLYSISYLWISPFSMFLGIFIGILVSLITGGFKVKQDPELIHPVFRRFARPTTTESKDVDVKKMSFENPGFVMEKNGAIQKDQNTHMSTKL